MSRQAKSILGGVVAVLIVIQFVGPSRPDVRSDNPEDLLVTSNVDEDVATLLRTACYDCHSMETNFPWYASVAPVSWRVYGHINHGRDELNFSEWASLKRSRKVRKLRDLGETVGEGDMPLKDYLLMHSEARLSDEQRDLLVEWADAFAREVMGE